MTRSETVQLVRRLCSYTVNHSYGWERYTWGSHWPKNKSSVIIYSPSCRSKHPTIHRWMLLNHQNSRPYAYTTSLKSHWSQRKVWVNDDRQTLSLTSVLVDKRRSDLSHWFSCLLSGSCSQWCHSCRHLWVVSTPALRWNPRHQSRALETEGRVYLGRESERQMNVSGVNQGSACEREDFRQAAVKSSFPKLCEGTRGGLGIDES